MEVRHPDKYLTRLASGASLADAMAFGGPQAARAGEMLQHQIPVKHILDEDVQIPAYVRSELAACVDGFGRTIFHVPSGRRSKGSQQ